ncbi:unnamed protein product [Adineta ricciae]|uniref:Protein translocase subunit SecA n=1 Tax=Adineta ricciae TaxID=249248 RepID=A0A814C8R6_ADIRI|nr:unnamed protein product [Adineta ricciae]
MENNKNVFFDNVDEIILSFLTHHLASLADPDTCQQIICAVKSGEELQYNLLYQIQTLAGNNDDVEGSLCAKHILYAYATWHSSFIEPTYFADLSELLKSADSTMRQCILWAFASTMPCTTILIPTIIECLYEYLHDSALQWIVLFIFRKMSENDEYIQLVSDDRWMSIISLSNDLELKEQARITVIHTMLNICRKRKQLADHIKLELEKIIISDSTTKKFLVVATKTLYKIVINGARVSSSTLDRLYELAANRDNSIIECVQELLEFLGDERNVSKVVLHSLSSDVKRELVVTRNTLIVHSQENVIAPLTDSVNFDHLLDTVVDFDCTSHIEIRPTLIETGDNQAWHRRTVSEINHLGLLAKQGSLKSQDFHYLSDKMDNGWRWLSITRRTTMQKLVATAFLDATNAGQTLPEHAIDVMIDKLLSTEYELGLICAECLLVVTRRDGSLQPRHIEKIERKLDECRNYQVGFVKEKIIELYALCVKNGHHVTLNLESIEDNLISNETSDKVSYLYFKAAAVGKRIFSPKHMKILCDMAKLKDRSLMTRRNCLGALQYSIKNMERKCSLKPELIDRLGEILQDANDDLRQSTAVTLCLIGNDENSRLPNRILEGLTVMLQCEDQKLVCNILSIYMKLVKAKERLSTEILDKLVNVFFRPDNDFLLRQQTIWILKYVVDNDQDLPSPVLKAIEVCLDDSESHIRNTAGLAFIQYWHKKVKKQHLLTTETEAIPQVVKLLKIAVVYQGHILLERTIAHLGCLLFGKSHLSNIAILLQLADRNQPLPSDIIHLLRQHYCADVLRYSNVSISKEKAANELLTMTSTGQHMPGSVVETLFKLLNSSQLRSSLLTIFVNIIDNGQRFEHHRIDFFWRILRRSEEESLINLMKIFTHLSRQNYLISDEIVRYLSNFLDKPLVSVYVVEIYQHLIEHHKSLDRHIVQKILRCSNSNALLAVEQNLQHRLIMCSKTIAHRWPEEINQADLPSLLDLYSSSPTISQDIYSIIEALLRNGLILIPDVVEKLKHLLNHCDNAEILSTVSKILVCAQSIKQVVHIEEDESFVQDLNKFSHALYTDDVNLKIEAANTISQRRLLSTQILSAIFTTLRDETINAITIPLLFQASVTLPSSVLDDLLYVMISSEHYLQLFFAYEQDWNQVESVATMLQSSNQADVSRALQIFQGMLALDQRIPCEVFLACAWLLSIHKDLTSGILIEALKHDIEMDADVYEAIQDVFLVYQSKQMFKLIQILTQKKIVLQLETLEILSKQITISESVLALEGAARNQLLPKEILSCLISQLSKESSLRTLSVLRYQMLQGAVEDLLEYLTKLRFPAIVDDEKLSQLKTFDQYLGTLHTLLFINYFDSTVFDLTPEQWSRECLCVELLTGCANNEPDEIVGLYHHLTLLEQYKEYDLYDDERDLILQELIQKQRTYSLSLSHINQILICLQTLTDHSLEILQSDDTNWFINLRRFFIQGKLDECLCNAIYSRVTINHLADRIAKQDVISADMIEIFLRSVQQPEHIITYLDMIEKHQITNTELTQLFSNVSNTKDFISLVREIELTVVNRLLVRQWHGPQAQLISARGYLHRLLELGWMLDKLIGMLSYVRTEADSCQSLAHFVDSLKTICQYKMKDDIVAILIILDRNHDSGRLLQVLTGEGKSTIVSILTVIKAIQGKRVDIVTSSITLAKRDVNQWKSFYEMFNLTAAHNNDETNYVEGFKCCYKANIVYGTASQFQFDILRDEFSLLKTRADRPFDLVIIDEVDSMLIDETNATARLADHLPGMEWLNPLLCQIWQIINKFSDPISNRDQILKTARYFIYNSKTQLKYPAHLSDFVSSSLPLWIDHGIQAKVEYRLDYQYIIKKDEMGTLRIMPIDYSNTGVIQCHTTWSDDLHQFLQIKHGLKMTPLTVTTNYMSNYDLFTRYKNEIYGFSGTLGSPDAQAPLSKIYQVDNIVIPPCKPKRHYQLETVLPSTDEDWLNTIVQNTIDHVNKRRAVLVICETRIDAKTIFKELQRQQPTSSIRLYTDNTDRIESNAVSNRVDCGDIIVATNLAGRGTDLKTTYDVEQHGGLHISLTFLPKNVRVEEQALGRTSRQGNRGTSQLILNRQRTFLQLMSWYPDYWNAHRHEFSDLTDIDIETIYDWRTQSESEQLDQIWKRDIGELKEKSRLFRGFCAYLTELKATKEYTCCLSSVKEQWGLWLKSVDQREQARRMLEKNYQRSWISLHRSVFCLSESL